MRRIGAPFKNPEDLPADLRGNADAIVVDNDLNPTSARLWSRPRRFRRPAFAIVGRHEGKMAHGIIGGECVHAEGANDNAGLRAWGDKFQGIVDQVQQALFE